MINGFVSEILGHFPKEGDQVAYKSISLDVVKVENTRVLEVIVEQNQLKHIK